MVKQGKNRTFQSDGFTKGKRDTGFDGGFECADIASGTVGGNHFYWFTWAGMIHLRLKLQAIGRSLIITLRKHNVARKYFLQSTILLILFVAAGMAWTQPDVSTVSLRVQHVKGCLDLVYPSNETGEVSQEKDRHEISQPASGGFGGIIATVNFVATSMSESRDGTTYSDDQLASAGYSSETMEDNKSYRVKKFTVARRVRFNLCIKPSFDGAKVTLEARHSDYDFGSKTEPGDLLQYATDTTTQNIRNGNAEFEARAKAAIDELIAAINQRTLPLEDIELIQMLRSTGIEKPVAFSFAGGNHSVKVKLRRVSD